MAFFKHVGTVNTKKVIIVQREMPGEDHMACVIYSSIMPSKYHDDVMKLLESNEGQSAWEFKDILERRMMGDGTNMLQALSSEGYLKRVPSNNVMVTPNSKSSMRLDELVKLLREAGGKSEETKNNLERMENNQGYKDPAKQDLTDSLVAESVDIAELSPAAEPVAPAAPVIDQTALMMEMMKTMQAMQAEIKSLKGDTAPAKKTTKSKTVASA
jgi:hypothetical protein